MVNMGLVVLKLPSLKPVVGTLLMLLVSIIPAKIHRTEQRTAPGATEGLQDGILSRLGCLRIRGGGESIKLMDEGERAQNKAGVHVTRGYGARKLLSPTIKTNQTSSSHMDPVPKKFRRTRIRVWVNSSKVSNGLSGARTIDLRKNKNLCALLGCVKRGVFAASKLSAEKYCGQHRYCGIICTYMLCVPSQAVCCKSLMYAMVPACSQVPDSMHVGDKVFAPSLLLSRCPYLCRVI
jgi:hypothetical protein